MRTHKQATADPLAQDTRNFHFFRPLSWLGVVLAILAFAAALTPSMIPRPLVVQGILGGVAAALAYLVGVAVLGVWRYLGLPELRGQARRWVTGIIGIPGLVLAVYCLFKLRGWQDSIRVLMEMEPLDGSYGWLVALLAIVAFVVLVFVGRFLLGLARWLIGLSRRVLPPRVAVVLGLAATVVVVWVVASGVLARGIYPLLDSSFREFDALIEPERPQPALATRSGGPQSLLTWQSLGRAGREFVASGPDAAQIVAFTGRPALEPIRTYVGLRAAETVEERAQLALEELKRAGGFERSMLVIVTPTGTGWIDPAAMDGLEYLQQGDIASVAMQYSYLSSPLSLTVHPEYGAEASRALFSAIYNHWTTLPRDQRPKLYLHGLSLGAMNSARSFELFELIGDPFNGAVWSGPPFASLTWQRVTNARVPGTPMWLPEFRNGSLFRFMNQDGSPVPQDPPWGATRLVYLQYASDAITFFSPHDAYRSPAWLEAPRGPDVSPQLRWYPLVTFLQLAVDMVLSTETPLGYGHVYAPSHYVNAWTTVADAPDWSPEEIERLKAFLEVQIRRDMSDPDNPGNPYESRGG